MQGLSPLSPQFGVKMGFLSILMAGMLCISAIHAQPATPTVRCDASRANQQITDQNGVYWCGSDQRRTPLSCIAPDQSRIEIGASYWTDTIILECRQPTSDTLQLVGVACLKNSQRIEPNQSINDGRYFYKCSGQSGQLTLTSTGCVASDGSQVAPGGTVSQGSFTYTCNVGGTTPRPSPAQPGPPSATRPAPDQQLTAQGCSFNGRQYKLGDDMELSGAWYKCTKDQRSTPTSVLTGCIVNGTKYRLNDTWRDEFFAFKCERLQGFVMGNAYACVERYPNGTVAEYAPGRKWSVGSGPHNRYIISCTKQGIQLRRRGIACFYTTDDGRGVLDSGCMKKVGNIMIQCSQPGPTPNVRIRITENPTAADEQRLKSEGMRFCESRPLESVVN